MNTRFLGSTLLVAGVLVTQPPVSAGTVTTHIIEIDCNDSSMENEGTKNSITAVFFAGGRQVGIDTRVPNCDSLRDAVYSSVHTSKSSATEVILQTSGQDGFWIDEMRYFVVKGKRGNPVRRQLAHWGRDGGKGYCLSKDPTDADRTWRGKVDGCHRAIKFDVRKGKAYPSKPLF